jgi:hypothetical protein
MPYALESSASFERNTKGLSPQQKEIIKQGLNALLIYFSTNNNLSEAQKIAPRFFFKQLRKPFYEVGIEGKLRIVLRKEGNTLTAVLAGNHDQVNRFLNQA